MYTLGLLVLMISTAVLAVSFLWSLFGSNELDRAHAMVTGSISSLVAIAGLVITLVGRG